MDKIIYGVQDNHLNNRAKFKEIYFFETFRNIQEKHIDTKKPYFYTFYFSTYRKAKTFLNKLVKKYEKKRDVERKLFKKLNMREKIRRINDEIMAY